MCCPLDQEQGRLVIQDVDINQDQVRVRGLYDRTPVTSADRLFRTFQRLELIEKIAEIADESFHLFGSLLLAAASSNFYQLCRDLHHAAHNIEHLLHAFCFVGDFSRVLTGKFLEYHDHDRKNLDYVRTTARVCQTVAHFLASVLFLHERNFIKVGRFEQIEKIMPLFGAAGYAIWTASILWKRHQGEENDRFASDIGIHLGGFFFEAIPLAKQSFELAAYAPIINKLSAAAGIVHAWCVVDRLMPQDSVPVDAKFNLDEDHDHGAVEHSPHHEHCDHHHADVLVAKG